MWSYLWSHLDEDFIFNPVPCNCIVPAKSRDVPLRKTQREPKSTHPQCLSFLISSWLLKSAASTLAQKQVVLPAHSCHPYFGWERRNMNSSLKRTAHATEVELLQHYKLGSICFDSPHQYTGAERALPSPMHWTGSLPQPWACIKYSGWGSAAGLQRMWAEHRTSCSCEKQQGQELPSTAPREERVSAQPYDNTKSMTVVFPRLLNCQHSKSQIENHSSWVTNTWLFPAWLPEPPLSNLCMQTPLIYSVTTQFAADKRGGNRAISFYRAFKQP